MIIMSELKAHPSSPTSAYGDLAALSKRTDLYKGDNFYFGFASSNRTFLDIIGGHEPLAIKYGPVFALYRRTLEGSECQIYYIDAKAKELIPVISMSAKPIATTILHQQLPWEFTNSYLSVAGGYGGALDTGSKPQEMIAAVIEQMANSTWPDDKVIEQLPKAIEELLSREEITMTLTDLSKLKQRMHVLGKVATDSDFVAAYNPFYDNVNVDISFLLRENSNCMTVREVNDAYPRIEVIVPGLESAAIFEKNEPKLYQALRDALAEPLEISRLLREHIPETVSAYLAMHSIDQPLLLSAEAPLPRT